MGKEKQKKKPFVSAVSEQSYHSG